MQSPAPAEMPACPICSTASTSFYPSHFPNAPWVYRCPGCRLCFVHPAPVFEQLAEMYDEGYTGSTEAAEMSRNLAPVYFRKISSFLPSTPGFRFLEIGGSYGYLSALVQEQANARVTLLEPGATATETARALPIEVVRGYTDDYVPAEPFDVVFAAHVVEHVPDLERFIRSCHGFLKPGGILLLLTPNACAWKLARFGPGWAWSAPAEHTHLLTPQGARLLLERIGFTVVQLKTSVPYWRQYPYFLTRQLSCLLTRLIGRTPPPKPASTPQAVASSTVPVPAVQPRKVGWKHYLRRSGRVILWAEYLTLSLVDRLLGTARADELLIAARRRG